MSTEIPSNHDEAETSEQLGSSLDIGGPLELVKEEEKRKKADWLAPYQFKPGQSGNPTGRKPGKSLKEYAKEMLATMDEEERQQFLRGIAKDKIWEMAEGKAKQDVDLAAKISISTALDEAENDGQTPLIEGVENPTPLQDPQQTAAVSEVQAEPSAGALQPTQMVQESDPQV